MSFASGAFFGGLFTAWRVAGVLRGVRDDVDMNMEYINMAINFSAVAFFGVLAKIDLDNGSRLTVAVEEKIEQKKQQKKTTSAMREREQLLKNLNINVRVSQDATKAAPVGIMQESVK